MTDEELIARLRGVCDCNIDSTPCCAESECRDALAAADRIEQLAATNEALVSENKMLRDAVYIDDLTVTMQASDRSKAMRAIGRALDFLNADMLVEAKTTLRAALKGDDHE